MDLNTNEGNPVNLHSQTNKTTTNIENIQASSTGNEGAQKEK